MSSPSPSEDPSLRLEAAASKPEDDRHPLAYAEFRRFWLARLCGVLGTSAQSAVVAWQVYETARLKYGVKESALFMGLLGLFHFLALFCMTIPAGVAADRYDRKRTVGVVLIAQFALSLGFVGYTYIPNPPFWGLFALNSVLGFLRAYSAPASAAIGPMLVPKRVLPRSIAVNSIAFQTGLIVGPALGGVLIAITPRFAYGFCAVLTFVASCLVFTLKTDTRPTGTTTSKVRMIREGWHYIWTNQVIFGAISLDLFAVLLGGATALMPIFAKDVLSGGPVAFGVLRASPAIGAILTSFALSHRPIRTKAGPWMFGSVALFGVATIAFGLSKNIWLSIFAMIVFGAADMISVYVRGTLIQIVTPDAMRGRVASVSYLFIGASNELGEFESGIAARILGPVGAAVFGGAGSLIVTGLWIKLFPALYRADRLE